MPPAARGTWRRLRRELARLSRSAAGRPPPDRLFRAVLVGDATLTTFAHETAFQLTRRLRTVSPADLADWSDDAFERIAARTQRSARNFARRLELAEWLRGNKEEARW